MRKFISTGILIMISVMGISQTTYLHSKNTLTAFELNIGESVAFTMENEYSIQLKLLSANTEVIFTTLDDLSKPDRGEGTIYKITCELEVDGQVMNMERFVPVQQTFTDPYLINGCYIWFDAVKKTGDYFKQKGGAWLPDKDARFAIWEKTKDICPGILADWYAGSNNYIDIRDCYNGDDTWLGTYFGGALHGGLDINMPVGTPLYAPLDFDDHYLFSSLAKGDMNNRWRGIEKWDNGDTWILQSHHIVDLLIEEHQPMSMGTRYAYTAGILAGDHPHTHFVFKTVRDNDTTLLDPWLIFWKTFEDNKSRAHEINARVEAVSSQVTGKEVHFSSKGSIPGVTGNELKYFWKFGDGGISVEAHPVHVYPNHGIYPVTLVIDDGASRDIVTMHVIVNGDPVNIPTLGFNSTDEPGFLIRDRQQMNVYGNTDIQVPMVQLFCRTRQSPMPKKVNLIDAGNSTLATTGIQIEYIETANRIEHLPHYRKKYYPGYEWLNVNANSTGEKQELVFTARCSQMEKGETRLNALVHVDVPGALNSPMVIPVQLYMPDYFEEEPYHEITVDNTSTYVTKTGWFWLSPGIYSYEKNWSGGYGGSFLINSTPAEKEKFVRYRPDLEEGLYQLSLTGITPYKEIAHETKRPIKIHLRINHRNGISEIVVDPLETLMIGDFEFLMGKSGFVDILAPREKGVLTIADAIIFKKIKQ